MPPDRISIKDESGAERTSVVGPYSEGDTINLYCEVFGGKYRTLCFYFRLVSVEPKCSNSSSQKVIDVTLIETFV